jgi:penicillin-binding protein 1A
VSTIEMASAYGTLAFGGQHVQPTPVISITKPDGTVLYEAQPKPKQVVNPAVVSVADGILQKVVQYGTGTAANLGRPQIGKTGTNSDFTDAWFVGAVPQLVTAVWVGFPQGQVSMCCGAVRIGEVFGGTWPAQIWHAFMFNAVSNMPPRPFPTPPEVEYVSLRIDYTQGCLANPFTPPMNIRTLQYIAGTEPHLKVCKEPSSYQDLPVPSVIGMKEEQATSLIRSSGFEVSVTYAPSEQRAGTVIAQDPAAGQMLMMTSTVTITVAEGGASPTPDTAVVPNVIGLTQSAAEAALRRLGFEVRVISDPECDPAEPSCDYHQGLVWAQSPSAGANLTKGSTVTVRVNP